jgi:polyribonucleotide nucleotidyltransferase
MTRKNVAYERARKKDAQEQQQRRPRRSSTSGPALLFAKVEVDSTKMGHVIGKSGETIKRITQEAGPNCSIWNKRGTNTFFLKAPIQATLSLAAAILRRRLLHSPS